MCVLGGGLAALEADPEHTFLGPRSGSLSLYFIYPSQHCLSLDKRNIVLGLIEFVDMLALSIDSRFNILALVIGSNNFGG